MDNIETPYEDKQNNKQKTKNDEQQGHHQRKNKKIEGEPMQSVPGSYKKLAVLLIVP